MSHRTAGLDNMRAWSGGCRGRTCSASAAYNRCDMLDHRARLLRAAVGFALVWTAPADGTATAPTHAESGCTLISVRAIDVWLAP